MPTILDLLVQTNSLDDLDSTISRDIIHDYEAQSLIRPFKSSHNGRRAWNFSVINSGGSLLAVTSAASPYRIVIPLAGEFQFRFTNLEKDPNEQRPLEAWTLDDLSRIVRLRYGQESADWVEDADAVGRWWTAEMHRLYNYHG